jgi:hypothetical protein
MSVLLKAADGGAGCASHKEACDGSKGDFTISSSILYLYT